MPSRPSLTSVSPLPAAVFPLTSSPFVIGRAREVGARLDHPLVQPRHAVLLEREDGWWLSGSNPSVTVNDEPLGGRDLRLVSGDRLMLAPGAVVRFDDGHPKPASPTAAADAPWMLTPRKRRRRSWRMPALNIPARTVLVGGAVILSLATVAGLGWMGWRQYRERPEEQPLTLSPADALVFDSLVTITLEHFERGDILLTIGAAPMALDEFAKGINVISTSRLRDAPYVRRRLDELRTSIGEVYRTRNVVAPGSLSATGGGRAFGGQGLLAALSVAQFASALVSLRSEFQTRFARPLEITGEDHPEHVSLYGVKSAMDLRSRDLSAAQIQFVILAARANGIRVKNFSQDSVLQMQVRAAKAAGVADRAGTGLHLHLDRFADRRDRWTVP